MFLYDLPFLLIYGLLWTSDCTNHILSSLLFSDISQDLFRSHNLHLLLLLLFLFVACFTFLFYRIDFISSESKTNKKEEEKES